MTGLRGPVIVTGTDTGVGKTITTAAVAATARAAGLSVAVVKPAQTGEDDDAQTVARLAEPSRVLTLARFPDPMSPFAAARRAGLPQLSMDTVSDAIATLTQDLVLIEGAGGLLVPMGENGWTVAELCLWLDAPAIVVCRAGLGTVNHTALTLEALRRRAIEAQVVIGEWPAQPDAVALANLADLSEMAGGLAGVLPADAGALTTQDFRTRAPSWLAPQLHGERAARP